MIPQGPHPKGVASMRVLPDVHADLRLHDPTSKAPATQPALPKKAPPTTGKGIPSVFYIGTGQVQPAPPPKQSSMWKVQPLGLFHSPTATPTTPAHPPRPSSSALPQPVQEPPNPVTLKNPLPEPAQQCPPNKQVHHKQFPRDQQGNPMIPAQAPSAVDPPKMSAPSPK